MLLSASGCNGNTSEKIVFTSRAEGESETYIYSMDLDGSNLVKLVPWDSLEPQPSQMWSADGKLLAFVEHDSETGNGWLCVVDANGKNKRKLHEITDFGNFTMSLSPDGRTIVFSLYVSRIIETPMGGTVHVAVTSGTELFAVDVGTGTLKQLTDTPDIWESCPSISPDGKSVSFVVRIETEPPAGYLEYVYVMDITGDNRRELAYHPEGLGLIAHFTGFQGLYWSPDSKKIAYAGYSMNDYEHEHFGDIFVIDVEKAECDNLTDSPYISDRDVSWSPDSSKIAYYSGNPEEDYYTWTMDADGKNKFKLIQSGPSSWTPNGHGLVSVSPLNVYEIIVIDANGENLRSLVKIEGLRISNPMWLND